MASAEENFISYSKLSKEAADQRKQGDEIPTMAFTTKDGKAYVPSGLLAMQEDMSFEQAQAFFKGKKQDKLNEDIASAFKVKDGNDFEGRKKLANQADTVAYGWGVDAHLTGGANA